MKYEKRREEIKEENRRNYERYREGEMGRGTFSDVKKQLEEESKYLQKRILELQKLVSDEKEILKSKKIGKQSKKGFVYEKLTQELLEKYIYGIYVYDNGIVKMWWKN